MRTPATSSSRSPSAPRPAHRDPVHAVADDPFPRLLQREDGRQGARHRAEGRHPARQPRGRGPGRPQGGRARRPRSRSARRWTSARPQLWTRVNALESPWVLDDLTHARHRDRRQARRDHGPEGRGRRGTSTTSTACSPSSRRRPGSTGRSSIHAILETAQGVTNLEEIAAAIAAHPGHELRPGRPRRVAAHEDDARRRRPSRLPRRSTTRTRRTRTRRARAPSRTRGTTRSRRMVDACTAIGVAAVLRPVRRHQGRRRAARPSSARRSCSAASAPGRCTRSRSTSPRRSSRPTPTRSSSPRRSSRRSRTAAAST